MTNDINSFLAMDIPTLGGEFNVRKIEPGDFVFLEGQPGDAAYVILKGEVQVAAQNEKGDLVFINNMTAGEMFGEIALLSENCSRTATTISEKGCELLVIDRLAFETHLLRVDLMTRYIMSQLCRRIVSLTKRAADSAPQPG